MQLQPACYINHWAWCATTSIRALLLHSALTLSNHWIIIQWLSLTVLGLYIYANWNWTMTKTGYKNIFIALLLLAFTSQSFATLMMPCQFMSPVQNTTHMDEMPEMSHAAMPAMDHSSMDHSPKTHSSKRADCCNTLDHCNSGSCSLGFFGQSFDLSLPASSTAVNISYLATIPTSITSSLFRPPIFC